MALDLDGLDDELVRRGIHPDVIAALSGGQPAAQPAQPAGGLVSTVQPGTRDYNLRVGATSQPNKPVSFVGPQPGPENAAGVAGAAPEMQKDFSGSSSLSFTNPQPAKPMGNPADPMNKGAQPVSFVKRMQEEEGKAPNPADYRLKPGEGPQGWKKWLDIAGQIAAPRVEALIPGSRGNIQRTKAQQFADAQAAHQERSAGVVKEAGLANLESEINKRNEPKAPENPKIAYHYANAEGREVSVFEDGTEKVGGEAQAKEGKHAPGEVRALEGIPDGIYGEQDKLWRANDPNMPPELKASLGDAIKAHSQKFQEDLQKQREGRAVYAGTKSTNFIMPDGTVRTVNGLDVPQFQKDNPNAVMTTAGTTERAMSKEAQFKEIHSGIDSARTAINNLDRDFTPVQIGKLTLAMRHTNEPTVFKEELETLLGTQELTPAQQDLVIWLGHLNERALSIRNIAGMGQGSDSMRAAIQAVLPNLKSGSKGMMIKQLAAFENQVNKLETGVPKMPGQGGGTASQDFGPAPSGKKDGDTGTIKVNGKETKIVVRSGRVVAQ